MIRINYFLDLGNFYSEKNYTYYLVEKIVDKDNKEYTISEDIKGYIGEIECTLYKDDMRSTIMDIFNHITNNDLTNEAINSAIDCLKNNNYINKINLKPIIIKYMDNSFMITIELIRE